MPRLTFSEILVVISSLTAAIVSIINTIGSYWGRQQYQKQFEEGHKDLAAKTEQQNVKLDAIEKQTNGVATIAAANQAITNTQLGAQVADIVKRLAHIEQTMPKRSTDQSPQ